MSLPRPRHQMIAAVESDRGRVESIAARPVRTLLTLTRSRAYRTWRQTRDADAVVAAVRRGMDDMVPLLADAMVAAHLRGIRRTHDNVSHFTKGRVVLSTAFDGAIEYLASVTGLSDDEVKILLLMYEEDAAAMAATGVARLTDAIEEGLRESIRNGVRLPPTFEPPAPGGGGGGGGGGFDQPELKTVARGTSALTKAFDSTGFANSNSYELDTLFETATQRAYGNGRWDSLNHPKLVDILWGFEYVAIIDDRTTKHICLPLNRMARPKDDEVWQRLWPPNHWRCRSTPLELFNTGKSTPVPAGVTAAPGFGKPTIRRLGPLN